MRRLFIVRKDLNMSPGKLSAQVAHCAEAYWTGLLRKSERIVDGSDIVMSVRVNADVMRDYVDASFVKTICSARNKSKLMRAVDMAVESGLVEGVDFGIIRDNCLTELEPEEPDGTTVTGIWFAPLPDEIAHKISRKYQLYR